MRNTQEIIDYLGLEMSAEYVGAEGVKANEQYIQTAQLIEAKYPNEQIEYALTSDIVCTPSRFVNIGEHLEIIEELNGLTVYKIKEAHEC